MARESSDDLRRLRWMHSGGYAIFVYRKLRFGALARRKSLGSQLRAMLRRLWRVLT